MRTVAVLSCVVGAGACTPGDELPPIVWSGEHLDFAPVAGGEELCAGTLPYMDRYLGLAGDAFGLSLGRTVYVLDPEGEVTPCDAYACAFDGTIYTRHTPHEHELIHATRTTPGYRFFEEGAAQAFGADDELFADRDIAEGPLREGIESCADESLGDRWYPRAGHFFAYLHRYHGPEVTAALFEDAPRGVTADEAIAALESATAMPFDALIADYENTEDFCELARWYRYPLYPCDAPEAVRPRCNGEVAIPIELSLGCDAETALGPRDGEVFGYVTIDIPASGGYRIKAASTDADHPGLVEFKECALGCASHYSERSYRGLDQEIWLREGRYALRFTRKADTPELSTMSITIAGDDCR